ncbi:hypothetical protein [Janthinobacterium sp. 78]|uniref:hypothetical protein n=1 Tax=Janthinobacterium sp. 78 TaxID=2135631 RepID=UPI001057C335|nr:hypothetical protein [Janthinobacterium sp. 78]
MRKLSCPTVRLLPAPLLGLLLLAAIPSASATMYAERGFGERDGNGSIASDLNPAGMRDLGILGGASSYASGLNTHGAVVGTAQRGDGYRRAFVYRPGTGMQEIGTLPGGRISSATAINDAGLVVGASDTEQRRWHAFAWDGKRMLDLGAMIGQGDSYATAVNAAGHVVGSVSIKGFEPMTFVYKEGVMTVRRRDDGLYLTNKITDAGLVVGAIYTAHKFQAFAVPSQAALAPQRSNPLDWLLITILISASGVVLYKLQRNYRMGLLGARTRFM